MTINLERLITSVKSNSSISTFDENSVENISEFNEIIEKSCTNSLLLVASGHQPIKDIKFSFNKMIKILLEHDILSSHNLKDRFYIFKNKT